MTRIAWSFDSILTRGFFHLLSSVDLEECELNILWTLGEKGSMSAYDLAKEEYFLPKLETALMSNYDSKIIERKEKHPTRYHYPFIHKTVKQLEEKEMVHKTSVVSQDRVKKIVGLTFSGLMLYLQNSEDKNKFKHALKYYPNLIPFYKQWNSMNEQLTEKRCMKALEQTVYGFKYLQKAKFRMRPLNLEFEGFLRNRSDFSVDLPEDGIIRERDEDVSIYLKSEEARILRDSYIAYMAVHDIKKISRKNKEQIEKLLPLLGSQKELAYFENERTESSSIFKGERLHEFLPRYASLECFFTGMFVENLMWKKTIKKHEPYDFEVENIR